jgi:hypothetical protein
MRMSPISTRVNKPENDDPSIVEPVETHDGCGMGALKKGTPPRLFPTSAIGLWSHGVAAPGLSATIGPKRSPGGHRSGCARRHMGRTVAWPIASTGPRRRSERRGTRTGKVRSRRKRTRDARGETSVADPEPTWAIQNCCYAKSYVNPVSPVAGLCFNCNAVGVVPSLRGVGNATARAHAGRLWAEANEPRGAVFQFTLPGADA